METVSGRDSSQLRNEYIDRYHYLGNTPLPGAQLRTFATARVQVVALFGFGVATWKTKPRDRHVGWTAEQRERTLRLLVENGRMTLAFLGHRVDLGEVRP